MIDENKVRLMTKLAVYEKKEDNRNLVISKYYKKDYVRYNVLKTWVASTVVYWSVVGAYVFMEFDSLLAKINDLDYFNIMYKMLGGYVVFCLVYFLLATALYSYRYDKAKPGLIAYNVNLKALINYNEGGRVVEDSEVKLAAESVNHDGNTYSARKDSGRAVVSRSAMVQQRIQQEEKLKEQQIINNVKQRNARLAAQNEAMLRKQRQMEMEKRRIQERRQQLEREQMNRLRNERMQNVSQKREDHVYQGDADAKDMGRRDR